MHYDVKMKGGWTQRALLKGRIDKGRHYDVEMKGWMENVALRCANEQGGWKGEGMMISK